MCWMFVWKGNLLLRWCMARIMSASALIIMLGPLRVVVESLTA